MACRSTAERRVSETLVSCGCGRLLAYGTRTGDTAASSTGLISRFPIADCHSMASAGSEVANVLGDGGRQLSVVRFATWTFNTS